MLTLTESQADVISKILGKLSERSTLSGVVIGLCGLLGINDADLRAQILGYFLLVPTLLLLVLNDKTVRSFLVRNVPTPAEVMEPEPAVLPIIEAVTAAPTEVIPMSSATLPSFVTKLKVVAALLPLVTSLVQTVEYALPTGSAGATKLKAVEDALQATYEKEQVAEASWSDVWPLISGVVTVLVATFKSTGAFNSTTPITKA